MTRAAAGLLLAGWASGCGACQLPDLRAELSIFDPTFTPLSAPDLLRIKRWWQLIGEPGAVAPDGMVAGFVSERLKAGKGCRSKHRLWWLRRNADGAALGQPTAVWRFGRTVPLAVQAPHQGSDRLTGRLARQWFEEAPIAAGFWNRALRSTLSPDLRPADLTHRKDHLLQAAAEGLATHPQYRFVQLHGFETRSRPGPYQVILSHGRVPASAGLRRIAACLERTLAVPIAVYPDDVAFLGGTRNELAAVLPARYFVHVEMGIELRQRLTSQRSARAMFFACFGEWATEPDSD